MKSRYNVQSVLIQILTNDTIINVGVYPIYRQSSTDGGQSFTINIININNAEIDNRWAAPYLHLLSKTFNTRIGYNSFTYIYHFYNSFANNRNLFSKKFTHVLGVHNLCTYLQIFELVISRAVDQNIFSLLCCTKFSFTLYKA
jgi:hypothetical protein